MNINQNTVQKDELISRLSEPVQANMVGRLIGIMEANELSISKLMDLCFHKKKEVAFRSAWMLEHLLVKNPEAFVLYVPALLSALPEVNNPSVMRHFSKMIALITSAKAPTVFRKLTLETDFEQAVETLFTWLIDPEVLVASKVHCMQSLANLVPKYSWIKDDLLQTMEHLTDIESIAFFARARMIRKQLSKKQ